MDVNQALNVLHEQQHCLKALHASAGLVAVRLVVDGIKRGTERGRALHGCRRAQDDDLQSEANIL